MSPQTIKTLNKLYQYCRAGERGFSTVAANVPNRGLKKIMLNYASQRRLLAAELKGEIERLGGKTKEGRSFLGLVHRGRIDIMSALTIGAESVERVVLREAVLGEKAVLKVYEKALGADLPEGIEKIIRQQKQQIEAAYHELMELRGQHAGRTLVRFFEREQDVQQIRRELLNAGFAGDAMEVRTLAENDFASEQDKASGQGSTTDETIISGAVGGGIWVGLLGALSGALMVLTPGLGPDGNLSPGVTWALITLGGVLVGMVFGAILGLLIGVGIREEHAQALSTGLKGGGYFVFLRTSKENTAEVYKMMSSQERNSSKEDKKVERLLLSTENGK